MCCVHEMILDDKFAKNLVLTYVYLPIEHWGGHSKIMEIIASDCTVSKLRKLYWSKAKQLSFVQTPFHLNNFPTPLEFELMRFHCIVPILGCITKWLKQRAPSDTCADQSIVHAVQCKQLGVPVKCRISKTTAGNIPEGKWELKIWADRRHILESVLSKVFFDAFFKY